MDPAIYRKRWHKVRDSKADADEMHQLARQIAFSFIDKHFQNGAYVAEYIDLLCEMATFYSKAELSNLASAALFEIVVEKLCDDFEDLPIEIYSRVMCQVVSYCRTVPAGKTLDAQLASFGIVSPDELYRRAVATHTRAYRRDPARAPRRVVLLSRVTIGADVAILSVMIQRLRRLFPDADMVVVGSRKLEGLFGGNPDVRIRELGYARRGGLFERFASWHATLDILREELAEGEESVLVIDPDSRISQLGVLPVMHTDNYLFFNTRDHVLTANGHCMAEWANAWIDGVFGVPDFAYPTIWIPPTLTTTAQAKIDSLRAAGARHIVAMNLGVGQNPRKRLSVEFEKRLLGALVAVPGTVVVLDRGFGADEQERSALLIAETRKHGFPAMETAFAETNAPRPGARSRRHRMRDRRHGGADRPQRRVHRIRLRLPAHRGGGPHAHPDDLRREQQQELHPSMERLRGDGLPDRARQHAERFGARRRQRGDRPAHAGTCVAHARDRKAADPGNRHRPTSRRPFRA